MGEEPTPGAGAWVKTLAAVVAGAYLGLVLGGCLLLALWGLSKDGRPQKLRDLPRSDTR